MTNTNKTLIKYFKVAPASVQEYMLTDDLAQAINSLSAEHALSEEQSRLLEANVMMVVLGVTDLQDFPADLQKDLKLEEAKSQKLLESVDSRIFSKIRRGLNIVHGFATEEEEAAEEKEARESIQNEVPEGEAALNQSELINAAPQKFRPSDGSEAASPLQSATPAGSSQTNSPVLDPPPRKPAPAPAQAKSAQAPSGTNPAPQAPRQSPLQKPASQQRTGPGPHTDPYREPVGEE